MHDPKKVSSGLPLPRRAFVGGTVALPIVASIGTAGCGASIPSGPIQYGGDAASVPQGTPVRVGDADVYLLRTEQGVGAISGQCPHRECGVNPREEGYGCPCHGSKFENDGTYVSGPANADLPWFSVRFENDRLVVDPTETVPKGTFTPLPSAG